MAKVTVNLNDLQINKFGTMEIRNEVYILTLGMDLSNSGQHLVPPGLMPDGFEDEHDWMLLGVSPLFDKVHRGDHLSLLGDGLLLYGPKDPGGKLSLHTAIMESDADHRKAAHIIAKFFSETSITKPLAVLNNLTNLTPIQIQVATAAIRYAFESVLFFLKNDGDDVISTFHYSSTYRNARGGYKIGDLPFSDRYVKGSIQVLSDSKQTLDENPYD